jgi:hypothetical protein
MLPRAIAASQLLLRPSLRTIGVTRHNSQTSAIDLPSKSDNADFDQDYLKDYKPKRQDLRRVLWKQQPVPVGNDLAPQLEVLGGREEQYG